MMLKMEHNNPSDPFSSLPLLTASGNDDDVDHKASITSLGYMELLGFQDYSFYSSSNPSFVFDDTTTYQPTLNHQEDNGGDVCDHKEVATVDEESSSVVLNGQPSSPNSSSICNNPKQCAKEKKATGGDEAKAKKKKKEKAPRFAFMTRTEIDHLDDGYRWRKYGQKAVKNSRFPRSYYRCTSASCNVKKRVERCMGDSSYVITTYEGQHNHPVTANVAPLIPSFNHLITNAAFTTTTSTVTPPPPSMLKLDHGGLLQDMLHCHH